MPASPSPLILLVDDDTPCRSLYRKVFSQAGLRVRDCASADQALEKICDERPALAVLDIQLKDKVDGYELCRRLQAATSPVDVFLVSGEFCGNEDRLKAYQAGAAAYYQKDVSPKELAGDIRFFLAESKPLAPRQLGPGQRGNACDVLLIDDDQDHLEAMALNLGSEGMTPFAARTGGRGLLLAHKLRPQAIVLDMQLPDATGSQILALLKAHPRTKHTPVWIWTGLQRNEEELLCLKGGAQDFLIKGAHEISSLALRIRQSLTPTEVSKQVLVRGPLSIGQTRTEVWMHGAAVAGLTDLEFHLLALLARRSPEIVPWPDIEKELRPYAANDGASGRQSNAVHVHLSRLKLKLGAVGKRCLVTHKALGLQFDPSRA